MYLGNVEKMEIVNQYKLNDLSMDVKRLQETSPPLRCLRITKCNVRQRWWERREEEVFLLRDLEAYYGKSRIITTTCIFIQLFGNRINL